MKVLEITQDIELGFDLFPRRPEGEDPVRSTGLHLTDIISDIMTASGMQKTASGANWAPDQLNMAAEVGFMWEEVFSQALKDRLPCRIGEVVCDGVAMSPDGMEMEMESGEVVLAEYKVKWASSKRDPTENFKWMAQVKGYCKGLGLTKVRMYVLYVNGDYRGSGPQFKTYAIEFTELEIAENWEMITGHARNRGWLK